MPFWKTLALAGAILAGGIGLAGGASASPLASGAMPAVQADSLVAKAWHYGRPHYGYVPGLCAPAGRLPHRPADRPAAVRPARDAAGPALLPPLLG